MFLEKTINRRWAEKKLLGKLILVVLSSKKKINKCINSLSKDSFLS